MEDLVLIRSNKVVCTSLQIAERFGKRHQEVLYAIEGRKCSCKGSGCKKCNNRGYQQLGLLQENLEINIKSHLSNMFKKSSYKDNGGRKRPLYYMDRDGFTLLAMGFTGEKALSWKIKYINAFNSMEEMLKERNTQLWTDTRQNNKENRIKETDVIKLLADYAKEQGSTHSDRLYIVYTKLAKSVIAGKRDSVGVSELNNLTLVESIILKTIQIDMSRQMHYKDIYKDCKDRIEQFAAIAYLTA